MFWRLLFQSDPDYPLITMTLFKKELIDSVVIKRILCWFMLMVDYVMVIWVTMVTSNERSRFNDLFSVKN
ncbi:hypothetical protein [Candidatus Hodgkinia cicadicola]|uniref:hypothetical protein n=1 Tax=Candidatus Hodgkinia cicadicola TaxID=573658 RepID=UPI0011BA5786